MILFLGMNSVCFFKVLKTIDFLGESVTFPVWRLPVKSFMKVQNWVLIVLFLSNVTHA